jgi:hypothetical protein
METQAIGIAFDDPLVVDSIHVYAMRGSTDSTKG